MNTINVNCNHCGTLLEADHSTKFVTCNACKSLLEIIKSTTSTYTIVKNENTNLLIGNDTDLNDEKTNAQIYAEIAMLDRQWNNELPNYMVNGSLPDGNWGLGYFMAIIFILFGLVIFLMALNSGMDSFLPILIGPIFIIGVVWAMADSLINRRKFREAKKSYEAARNELQLKLKK